MANVNMMVSGDDVCSTCAGHGYLIADTRDARGERIDDEQPCPDCTSEPDEYEHEARLEREYERCANGAW